MLQKLSARGVFVGMCGPGGVCSPGWAGPPKSNIKPEHVLVGVAALGLGIVPWIEPVTLPVLQRLATP